MRSSIRPGTILLLLLTAVASFIFGVLVPVEVTIPGAQGPTATAVHTPTISPTLLAVNMDVYPELTVFWNRSLWETAVGASGPTEDFENDPTGYNVIVFPYLTGKGFLIEGESSAQVLDDSGLLDSGALLHFRDFADGLRFHFPSGAVVSGFGFDYKASEVWELRVGENAIVIPGRSRGFLGVVAVDEVIGVFQLSSSEHAQGGLSVDNISFVPADSP